MAAKPNNSRREGSNIYLLEFVDHIRAATLVALSRAIARNVQVHDQPSLVGDRLQHAMATRKIDVAAAQIEDTLTIEAVRLGAGKPLSIFIIRQNQPCF